MDYVIHAKQFIEDVVVRWMIGDLDSMEAKIPHIQDASGNCNFPIALSVFSCIEFLGYLTSVNLIDSKTSGGYTLNRVNSYIDMFFNPNYLSQIKPFRSTFVNIFRHGLAHEYFAKSAGISRNTGTLVTVDKVTGSIVLDADEFYQAFKASVDNLKNEILQNKDGIAERIITRYNALQADNAKYKPSTATFTTSTPTSNATIAKPVDLKQTTTLPYKP